MWLDSWFENEEALFHLAGVRKGKLLQGLHGDFDVLHDSNLASLLYRQTNRALTPIKHAKRLDFHPLLASSPHKRMRLEDPQPLSPPPQEREECAKSVLETRAESWGLAIVPIQGDGSCMFRAISHQLFGVEDHHQLVRMLALKEVSANPDTYLAECTQQQRETYLQDMQLESTWGDEAMLRACAQCLDVTIVLVHDFKVDATPIQIAPPVPPTKQRPLRCIHLGFYHELHYVSLVAGN